MDPLRTLLAWMLLEIPGIKINWGDENMIFCWIDDQPCGLRIIGDEITFYVDGAYDDCKNTLANPDIMELIQQYFSNTNE